MGLLAGLKTRLGRQETGAKKDDQKTDSPTENEVLRKKLVASPKKTEDSTAGLTKKEIAGDVDVKAKAEKRADSKNAYKVLVRPLITEKAARLGVENKYFFAVNPNTNKVEIKKAIAALYHVKPIHVAVMNMGGKYVRAGRSFGRRKDWKKAIITLKAGDKITVYEGV